MSNHVLLTECVDFTVSTCEHGHFPILIKLDYECLTQQTNKLKQKVSPSKIAWHNITSYDSYRTLIDELVSPLSAKPIVSLDCCDLRCDNPQHRQEIDNVCSQLSDICLTAADRTLPKVKVKKTIPQWNKYIAPLKADVLFWGKIWRDMDRPSGNVVHTIYKSSRRKYHYAIRAHKNRDKQLRMANLAENIANNDSRNLWKEIKKIKGHSKVCPPNIDGSTDPKEINNIFKSKYETLYNSAASNLDTIYKFIDCELNDGSRYFINESNVSRDLIDQAIHHLKRDKSDGDKGVWSTLVVETPASWRSVVAKLIQSMIKHGHYASELLTSTIISLPKDIQGSAVCNSENYRGIALMSCINKIVDWVLLLKYPDCFRTSDQQFAFKRGHSTSMCTLALKEVANYYLNRKGNVFCSMLDASKAFDGVKYDKLFEVLMKRGLPSPILRLLLYQYTHQRVRTFWKGETSGFFHTVNGVRQGGVLSPILFTVYLDVLLERLRDSGVGCMVGQSYFGVLCYADDVTLLSPTVFGLQKMLQICEQFGSEFNIRYNPKKTVCMCFHRKRIDLDGFSVRLYGKLLPWSESAKHLGNIVRADLKDDDDIQRKRCDFIGRTNSLLANFKAVPRSVCSTVFNSQCCHLYGTETWDLGDKKVTSFCVAWRKAVRKIWCLPNDSRSVILPHLVKSESIEVLLCNRFKGLYKGILNSDNSNMKSLLFTCESSCPGGIISKNLALSNNLCDSQSQYPGVCDRANLIKEIRRVLENDCLEIKGFDQNELLELTNCISQF